MNTNSFPLLLSFILLLIAGRPVYAQIDSIANQISKYQNGKSDVISKGRRLLLDKYMENDNKKVGEIIDYFDKEIEDANYITLYPIERIFLYYSLRDYRNILQSMLQYDSSYFVGFNKKIRPAPDDLYKKLVEQSREKLTVLNLDIELSDLSNDEKDFLKLNLKNSLWSKYDNFILQDTLNSNADTFLKKYPQSRYYKIVRKDIRYVIKPSGGFGVEFFSGYGFFTGQLANQFNNNVPLGVAFDIYFKKIGFCLRDYIGFSSTLRSIQFTNVIWVKGDQVRVFLPELSIGYVTIDNKQFRITPFAGIASTDISPTSNDQQKKPGYDKIDLKWTMTYTFGISTDFKLGKSRNAIVRNGTQSSYFFLRIRYACNLPQFNCKYSGFGGVMHNITIGIGSLGRRLKRDL